VHTQAITVTTTGDMLHVRAPGLRFLEGRVLADLRDGRAVLVSVALELLPRRGAAAFARAAQDFNVSFDLWEERFAVTRTGQPPRIVSQLTSTAAEAWCLENVVMPLANVPVERRAAAWVRVTVRAQSQRKNDDGGGTFGIPRLIDALSRRGDREPSPRIVEGGPFRLGS
jgi:hypothetical protein